MDKTTNSLNWFEIPANDLERSKKFYETIFNIQMDPMEMDDSKMAFFPWEAGSGKVTGAVVQNNQLKPSMEGTLVYLNVNPNMDGVQSNLVLEGFYFVNRVRGSVLLQVTEMAPFLALSPQIA